MSRKKTVHIKENIHKMLKYYIAERDLDSYEGAVEKLIISGLKSEDLPDYIMDKVVRLEELPTDKDTKKEKGRKGKKVELSDLPTDIIELTKELKGGKAGSKESVKEIALGNLRYLINQKEASKKDFINNVYPRFESDHSKKSYWKVSRFGFKQIEELTDRLKTPSTGHKKYKFKD